MLLKWTGHPDGGHYLEGFPARDHEETDQDRIKAALESGLFVADELPKIQSADTTDQKPQPPSADASGGDTEEEV